MRVNSSEDEARVAFLRALVVCSVVLLRLAAAAAAAAAAATRVCDLTQHRRPAACAVASKFNYVSIT